MLIGLDALLTKTLPCILPPEEDAVDTKVNIHRMSCCQLRNRQYLEADAAPVAPQKGFVLGVHSDFQSIRAA